MTHAQALAPMMGKVAKALLGEPNAHLSKPRAGILKYGSRGSMEVNVTDGWFSDYESKAKGGVLELIKHRGGVTDDAGALRWLEDQGIKERGAPVSTFYDYRDETGAVLFRVERKQAGSDKTFRQHGPDGVGGFRCVKGCMRGVRRVLYRLPELLASDPAQVVFYCEGEKDADRLASLGLVATTHPGGAGNFEVVKDCLAAHLSGRRVALLEDNDQAGADHAAKGHSMLRGIAADVAAIKLPGLLHKGDVSDWLDLGHAAADLHDRAMAALTGATGADATVESDLVPMLDLAALSRTPAMPKAFTIERIAPSGEVTMLYGPGSAGKSLLGQQLATVAAAGTRDAQEALALAKDGALTGLSIGWKATRDTIDQKSGARVVTEAELFEGSLVAVPMNDRTRVTSIKAIAGARDIAELLQEAGFSNRKARLAAGAAWKSINEQSDEAEADTELAALIKASTARLRSE